MSAMTPATETEAPSKPAKLPEGRRLNGIVFVHPTFQDARSSISVSDRTCMSITAVVFTSADGDLAPIEKGQQPAGFLVRRKMSNPHERIVRDFIPWANVANLTYAE